MTMDFIGVRVVETVSATELIGHEFSPIPWSHHRSIRLWRKLQKRQRRTICEMREPCVWFIGEQIFAHPACVAMLKDSVQKAKEKP